jgi:hypothetical protein
MSDLKIQVDVWGGDLHQNLVREHICTKWSEVFTIIENECETGNLVNILCLDFKVPESRRAEMDLAIVRALAWPTSRTL